MSFRQKDAGNDIVRGIVTKCHDDQMEDDMDMTCRRRMRGDECPQVIGGNI
jgi:hypothetical protein